MSTASRLSFIELFTPKLVTVLREGYDFAKFRADALAELTVAIIALPLSMAIAIACGTTPDRGLYTAIVGGFLISLLGGSRFQIGGPAAAFIVLIAATLERHGYDGLVLATMIAGAILIAFGLLRLGTYIKYIPHSVIVGFTAGIAVIILTSQLRDLLGLSLASREPAAFLCLDLTSRHAGDGSRGPALAQGTADVRFPRLSTARLRLLETVSRRRMQRPVRERRRRVRKHLARACADRILRP